MRPLPDQHTIAGFAVKDIASIIAAAIALGGTLVTATIAFIAMRHTATSTRYKNYLDAFKTAKDAGLTGPKDEVWARDVLALIAEEAVKRRAEVRVFSTMFELSMFALALALFLNFTSPWKYVFLVLFVFKGIILLSSLFGAARRT